VAIVLEHYFNIIAGGKAMALPKYTTQRKERDIVQILSGVFEGRTTGTPISLIIHNEDVRSKDYSDIKNKYRPGHADYTYQEKYGIRDYRGGGRSSARETAMRVAAGAIARKLLISELDNEISFKGAVVQIGNKKINSKNWDWDHIEENDFWSPDKDVIKIWEDELKSARKEGSSLGAIVEVHVKGAPKGLGAPVYDKLDADIAKALMSINAVKAVEIGAGFDVAELRGEENVDQILKDEKGNVHFESNNAGGILGGISTGQDIIARIAFKPTSSILIPQKTIDIKNNETEIITKGRHDPCVGIRGTPIAEAMMACVIADHWLRHKAQCL
jgi:chorismate synthase